jgi:hypothetical protein
VGWTPALLLLARGRRLITDQMGTVGDVLKQGDDMQVYLMITGDDLVTIPRAG